MAENQKQLQILQWTVIFLLAFLTFISAWSKVESAKAFEKIQCIEATLPKDYVPYSRYIADRQDRTQEMLLLGRKIDAVDDKIDAIIKMLMTEQRKK
jgi:hypothetical protein